MRYLQFILGLKYVIAKYEWDYVVSIDSNNVDWSQSAIVEPYSSYKLNIRILKDGEVCLNCMNSTESPVITTIAQPSLYVNNSIGSEVLSSYWSIPFSTNDSGKLEFNITHSTSSFNLQIKDKLCVLMVNPFVADTIGKFTPNTISLITNPISYNMKAIPGIGAFWVLNVRNSTSQAIQYSNDEFRSLGTLDLNIPESLWSGAKDTCTSSSIVDLVIKDITNIGNQLLVLTNAGLFTISELNMNWEKISKACMKKMIAPLQKTHVNFDNWKPIIFLGDMNSAGRVWILEKETGFMELLSVEDKTIGQSLFSTSNSIPDILDALVSTAKANSILVLILQQSQYSLINFSLDTVIIFQV
ncbi:hypothetical protein BC833DRAFT_189489 [Globomyces pollinis-pini]|nr:hypothetical protein BC833DRAFT_189489 [Globomyces pollinis-pini]